MIDVKELNKKIQAIGLSKIGFITEDINGNGWDCYVDPAVDGKVFGFNAETCTFGEDTPLYWDTYKIVKSTLDGMYDIIFIGYGPAYVASEC